MAICELQRRNPFGRAQGLSEAVKRREYELFWLVLKQQTKLSTSVILTGVEW